MSDQPAPPPEEEPTEQPQAEQPQAEQPQAEQPQAEQPQAEQPQAEQPQAEQPQAEQPQAEQPQAEQPQAEQPQAEQPQAEQPQAEQPQAEQPQAEQPQTEQPQAEQPQAEQPQAEQPQAEQPQAEQEPARPAVPTPAAVAPSVSPAPAAPAPPSTPAPAAAQPAPAATPSAPASDPSQWGRVADDGTVYVRTADGERAVGSYPGATPEEALAYFGRKYDELAGQVDLLEQRVRAGGVAPKDAAATLAHLRESVTDAHAVGDLAGLLARLDGVEAEVARARARADEARAAARKAATETKERIVAEAEQLADSTDWKRTGDRLRDLLEEWKKAPRLERKVDDTLWKRFSHARSTFDKRRRTHFAELDAQRGEAAERKEKLIKKAEELSSSTDWGETAKAYRDLMTQWKAAGRARRDVEDALWARFRAAQDTFFAARSEVFAERDAGQADNLAKKRELAAEAERLLPVTDHRSARAALRSIHDRWEAVGHVPRANRDEVENRLKKVDDAVRAAEEAEWARSNPEARARAEATVGQLRASIAGLEQDAAKARAAGDERKAADAETAAATRRTWLVEAEKTLAEFS